MHVQLKNPQGKFLTIIEGKIFDVIVDLRKGSKTFKKCVSIILDSKKKNSIYIPEGCAHGFLCLKKSTLHYLFTQYRDKKNEIGIKWNDLNLNINWPIKNPILSTKDKQNITINKYLRIL